MNHFEKFEEKKSVTPLFNPLENCLSNGGGQNNFKNLSIVYGIQNEPTDQTKTMQKEKFKIC